MHAGKGVIGLSAASPERESALSFEAPSSVCQAAFCLEAIHSADACEAKTVCCVIAGGNGKPAERGRTQCLITLYAQRLLAGMPADPHHRQNRDIFHGPPCSESTLQWCD